MLEQPHQPRVVFWYKVYCFASAIGTIACYGSLMYFMVFFIREFPEEKETAQQLRYSMPIFLVMGGFFTVTNIAAGLLPRRPWSWGAGVTNLVLGTMSAVCAPLSVPLLIFWMREDVRKYFGVQEGEKKA